MWQIKGDYKINSQNKCIPDSVTRFIQGSKTGQTLPPQFFNKTKSAGNLKQCFVDILLSLQNDEYWLKEIQWKNSDTQL